MLARSIPMPSKTGTTIVLASALVLLATALPAPAGAVPPEPYIVKNEWTGYMACEVVAVGTQTAPCAFFDPNHATQMAFPVDPGLRSLVLALDWDPGLTPFALGDPLGSPLQLTIRNEDCGHDYRVLEGDPPLETIIGPDEGGECSFRNLHEPTWMSATVRLGGGALAAAYQQEFTLYWHEYHWEEADEGASALP